MRYYGSSASACADPGIFTKWGGGGGGGGGGRVEGPGPPDSKKLGQLFLLFLLFLVLTFNLFNSFTEGTNPRVRWFIFWKTIIFQGSRGRPTFYGVGRGPTFFEVGGERPNANFCRNLSKL